MFPPKLPKERYNDPRQLEKSESTVSTVKVNLLGYETCSNLWVFCRQCQVTSIFHCPQCSQRKYHHEKVCLRPTTDLSINLWENVWRRWYDKYWIRSRIKLVEWILSKMPWLLMRSILTCLLSFFQDNFYRWSGICWNLSSWFLLNATLRNMFCSYKTMPRNRDFNRQPVGQPSTVRLIKGNRWFISL